MKQSHLIPVTYRDPTANVRVTGYADTLVFDKNAGKKDAPTLCAIRLGGYPEQVRALSDGLWGGGLLEAEVGTETLMLQGLPKRYRKQLTHNGVYAEATLVADDDIQQEKKPKGKGKDEDAKKDEEEDEIPPDLPPRSSYIFCEPGDKDALFREVDRKTAVPLIPAFRDYVLSELERRGDLKPLTVCSAAHPFDAWALRCTEGDGNIISVVEDGLACGDIVIPGDSAGPSPFGAIESVMGYLNEFGVVLAQRIKELFVPLFDPASEPLSTEILAVNDSIQEKANYSLYDAQLAVAEAVKRRLQKSKVALIIAECGSGKSKIGSAALGALWGLHSEQQHPPQKTFNLILCPSHMKGKWVREIEETLPNTFAATVDGITSFDRLYQFYEQGERSCYAVISKEKARDGYMRTPAVVWSKRKQGFICPDCGAVVEMTLSDDDGARYTVPADQFYFKREHRDNHKCEHCGSPLWSALNPWVPADQTAWVKLGDYGFVCRAQASEHLKKTKTPAILEKLQEIVAHPEGRYPAVGAHRAYPLSTYIKKKYRGRIDGLLCDELHQYNNNSGQGDAMGELAQAAKKVIGMTATLINGYSSGLFYLLYRIAAPLMQKDGKTFQGSGKFNDEYGVVQSIYETKEGEYSSNRKTLKTKKNTRQLPGVSPMVYSRFLLESAVFLSLTDMGKDLPEYEEIPIPLAAPEPVMMDYQRLERDLKAFLKEDRKAAQKILSAYMNLLMAYPDQPYNEPPVVHPFYGSPIVEPEDTSDYETLSPKDKQTLDIVVRKMEAGERVLIYTNWTRLDSQRKLKELLTKRGYRTEILQTKVAPDKREKWVADHVSAGMRVLITNPSLCETGLDLNDFTTIIFYDTGYKLFTFRQASRRSWRINQTAPRVEVYILYYKDTMQHKAIKLMASKLAVAGIIEGNLSDEGLAAMSECEDMASVMAKELAAGIKDSVEDVSAMFKKMAFLKPERPAVVAETPTASEEAPTEKPSHSVGRTAAAALPYARPEGEKRSLLERSVEIQTKKKKVKPVLEGQFSMFGELSA